MRRKVSVFIIIAICFLLQTTLFQALSFASISPNLLIIVVSSFGFMRGKKEGMYIGFACGLLLDIFGSGILGFYALLYMYIGYINGYFRKMFYPEDLKLPMLLIAGSDLGCNLLIYFFFVFVPQPLSFSVLPVERHAAGACLHHADYHLFVCDYPESKPAA